MYANYVTLKVLVPIQAKLMTFHEKVVYSYLLQFPSTRCGLSHALTMHRTKTVGPLIASLIEKELVYSKGGKLYAAKPTKETFFFGGKGFFIYNKLLLPIPKCRLTLRQVAVYSYIVFHGSFTVAKICNFLGISDSTVHRSLNVLKDEGLLTMTNNVIEKPGYFVEKEQMLTSWDDFWKSWNSAINSLDDARPEVAIIAQIKEAIDAAKRANYSPRQFNNIFHYLCKVVNGLPKPCISLILKLQAIIKKANDQNDYDNFPNSIAFCKHLLKVEAAKLMKK